MTRASSRFAARWICINWIGWNLTRYTRCKWIIWTGCSRAHAAVICSSSNWARYTCWTSPRKNRRVWTIKSFWALFLFCRPNRTIIPCTALCVIGFSSAIISSFTCNTCRSWYLTCCRRVCSCRTSYSLCWIRALGTWRTPNCTWGISKTYIWNSAFYWGWWTWVTCRRPCTRRYTCRSRTIISRRTIIYFSITWTIISTRASIQCTSI